MRARGGEAKTAPASFTEKKGMDEQQWLSCDYPPTMLTFLKRRASKRKLRLFSVACCRRIWPLIGEERSRAAVLVAERFADGDATSEELQAAMEDAKAVWLSTGIEEPAWTCFLACTPDVAGLHASGRAVDAVAFHQLGNARRTGNRIDDGQAYCQPIRNEEQAAQCRLLRDIIGNPFRPLPPRKGKRAWEERRMHWLNWNDATIRHMAESIYEERAFDRLPILGDALEDAGCNEAEILDHVRSDGSHVRGCWVIDLLLGKE
jgi:hypothetical protein